jgi:hypothetical protein
MVLPAERHEVIEFMGCLRIVKVALSDDMVNVRLAANVLFAPSAHDTLPAVAFECLLALVSHA